MEKTIIRLGNDEYASVYHSTHNLPLDPNGRLLMKHYDYKFDPQIVLYVLVLKSIASTSNNPKRLTHQLIDILKL